MGRAVARVVKLGCLQGGGGRLLALEPADVDIVVGVTAKKVFLFQLLFVEHAEVACGVAFSSNPGNDEKHLSIRRSQKAFDNMYGRHHDANG